MRRSSAYLLLCVLVFTSPLLWGQQVASAPKCSLPPPPFLLNRSNIFSDQQEEWLGEAEANQIEPDHTLLPEQDSAELTLIGQKLLAQLPPTLIHYHFRVYEAEDANAFSIVGGYVYLSRKLITDARNEDEIAGVLAHEIGHIYTHQVATEYTRMFKVRMNLGSIGNQDDVNDKMQQLLNARVKYNEDLSEAQEDKDELLADRVGMYAMTRAGYAPRAFAECLDRISANKGRLGSFLTDMLDINSIVTRRVRAARSLTSELTSECKSLSPGASPEFKEFQQKIRSAPVNWLVNATPGLQFFKMDPPMRPALDRVRFSANGEYVLAQDETRIHVLSRSPLKLLFSINAPGAENAHFTPDSTQVVFHYQTMRVERWSVTSGKRDGFFELVDYRGCRQTSLAPDGKTFVCLSLTQRGVWLKLMDVDTGKLFYDNRDFYEPDEAVQPWSAIVRYFTSPEVGTLAYSQDGRTLVVATGSKAMAYDLVARKPFSMKGDLSGMVQGAMTFVDSDKLVFDCEIGAKNYNDRTTFKMCETTFPEGLPIHDFQIGYQWMDTVAHGNHVLIGPLRDSASVLVDPSTGKASAAFKLDALDLYDQTIASETASGGVTVGELGSQKMESVDLPVGPMPDQAAAEFSPDGHFLAVSNRSRSTIWDLNAQKQIALMRPFRAVRFDDQNQMFAQYLQSHMKPGQNSHIDLRTGKVTEGAKYDINALQTGTVLVNIREKNAIDGYAQNTEMVVSDLTTGAQLWTKRFPHATPIVRSTDGDTLLLIMDLGWQTATDETAHTGDKFIRASDKKGEWLPVGTLVELLDSRTGDVRRQIAVPQYSRQDFNLDSRSAELYGDYLVVYGNYNNSTIYSVSDGKRLGAFYGKAIAGDDKLGLIAATNRAQEIVVYEAATGKELKRVVVDHLVRAARFIQEKQALLVLTASQRVYTIDVPKTRPAETSQAK
ncbi:MAG: M48 family metalloprotease [Terracidiphilus sp.]|jgi:WD40 repeat protein